MRIPRFYTSQPLSVNHGLTLEIAPSHHLLKVLRAQPGDPLILFNGNGNEYHATLNGSEGKRAQLTVTGTTTPTRESGLQISLGQGVSRGERMDVVIQKAVELGANDITPLWTRRSQVRLAGQRLDKRLSHWHGILLGACEQSGRVRLPALHPACDLDDWLGAPAAGLRLVLDPEAEQVLHDIQPQQKVQVLLGPEGGLEKAEVDRALAAGFQPVRLGPRILRTETATLATLSALQTLWGDFGRPT